MMHKPAAKFPPQIAWWEKSVEYAFVRACRREWVAVPLGVGPAGTGDALFGEDAGWLLIDFKKDRDAIGAEATTYKDFDNAARQLKDRDGHHVIVYGIEAKGPIEIQATTYFSQRPVDVDKLHLRGSAFPDFKCYLDRLLALKKKATGPERCQAVGAIVGLAKKDLRAVAMTLEDFNRGFRHARAAAAR